MLHTRFEGHWTIGSEEEDFLRFLPYIRMATMLVIGLLVLLPRRFLRFLPYIGHGSHVGHVTQLICINFHSHAPLSFHMNFGSKSPNCFSEKQDLTLKSE